MLLGKRMSWGTPQRWQIPVSCGSCWTRGSSSSVVYIYNLLISCLRTRCLRGISRNNQVTLHVILLGVGGTIYNQYTITPLLADLGIPTHKVHQLATKLHCHAIKSLNKITKTRHKIHLNNNSDNGGSDGGVTGRERLASRGLGAGRNAW